METMKRSVVARGGGSRSEMNRAQRIFRTLKIKILYNITMLNVRHYTFVSLGRVYNTKSEP